MIHAILDRTHNRGRTVSVNPLPNAQQSDHQLPSLMGKIADYSPVTGRYAVAFVGSPDLLWFAANEISLQPINIVVRPIGYDDWCRPCVKNITTDRIYADIDCGEGACTKYGLPGNWHTTTEDGEPCAPLSEDIRLLTSKT